MADGGLPGASIRRCQAAQQSRNRRSRHEQGVSQLCKFSKMWAFDPVGNERGWAFNFLIGVLTDCVVPLNVDKV